MCIALSGPLSWLNTIPILSLLRSCDRYKTPSATGSAIGGRYLGLSRICAQVGALHCLVLNHLGSLTARLRRYRLSLLGSKMLLKTIAKQQNALEAAILDHVLDRD